ncbi:nitric oxide reductase transcriptional regulator NorR [Enterovibrio sp. ZSDZ35]|uniref:Nitric oxide reductase transcriptional regulator NorR n=1 Tax=Enterovibrio qingdaonensis TaxID=2899818 RepID=A0ABT5QP55_9GAMM|nr:nitric oxide reductase transcriptional regulator NorR [Enterovibrio sp. ZSDZ35]MDD1782659.1 nitric oxide reductase transcriptional regulator NorR [Enterovibrio sp. ZSDZ35]
MHKSSEHILLQIALNLSSNLSDERKYQQLLDGIEHVFPCDANAIFVFDEDGFLKPVAVNGLSTAVLGRRFFPDVHPRLKAIVDSRTPVRFDANSPLPDPFDGYLLGDDKHIDVHDCMGCSLHVDDKLVGVITMDSRNAGVFDSVSSITLETYAALTAATLRNISQVAALKAQNRKQHSVNQMLIQQARSKHGEMVGLSPQMHHLRHTIDTVAESNYAVLISGETGTGKELVAHQLHAASQRSDKPMVYVNCAALPEGLAESELFGHVKGAFTGANNHRAGKFELADGGTLFLDEVGELPLVVQAKLLRVIQQGELQRVGSDQHLVVDVRIIAATNRDLIQEVAENRFRADLYHRLNVFPISVPSLRQREGDIPVLAGYLLEKVRHQFNVPNLHIHPQALALLERQAWPGNVRELEHSLTRAALRAIQSRSVSILTSHFDALQTLDDVKNTSKYFPEQSQSLRTLIDEYQRDLIEHALSKNKGVWAKAAQFLQTDRGNLYRLGKKLGF